MVTHEKPVYSATNYETILCFLDEPQYRRKRVAFTDEEERFLIEGIHHIGVGKWTAILRRYKFQQCRTSVSLKDKYRTMKKQGFF